MCTDTYAGICALWLFVVVVPHTNLPQVFTCRSWDFLSCPVSALPTFHKLHSGLGDSFAWQILIDLSWVNFRSVCKLKLRARSSHDSSLWLWYPPWGGTYIITHHLLPASSCSPRCLDLLDLFWYCLPTSVLPESPNHLNLVYLTFGVSFRASRHVLILLFLVLFFRLIPTFISLHSCHWSF